MITKTRATDQQRATAHTIWRDLDRMVCNSTTTVSNVDFYAVWGLINAILNNENWDEEAYNGWMTRLYEVWAEVSAKYTA